MKKIKVNAEQNKKRLEIPTDNGTIIIENPNSEFKNEIIKYMVTCIMDDIELDERKILLDLIDNCTNVEFDKDIFEAVNLSHEAQMITNEVLIIFQEIVGEAGQVVRLILQQTKNELEQKEIIEENNKVLNKINEVQEIQEDANVPHRTVRKPQRSRGRIVRK